MLTKQPCHHCGTNIEFDADQLGEEYQTVSCPRCQEAVTLLKPPPVAAPPVIQERKRRRLPIVWVFGTCVAVLVALILLLFSVLNPESVTNPESAYAIVPEPYYDQKPISESLDRYAFDLGIKELNKLFFKHGEFVFAHRYISLEKNRYVQGKRVIYTFSSDKLSDADVMNGWEFKGDVHFFIAGSKREYNPNKDQGWSEWTMFPGDAYVENSLYGTTLWLRINKKKGGDWELTQPADIHPTIKQLSRDKVEELLKLPSKS